MKKLFLGAIAVMFMSLSGFAMDMGSSDNEEIIESKIGIIGINIKIRFGHGANCEHRKGLCKIEVGGELGLAAPDVFNSGSLNGRMMLVVNEANLVAINRHYHANAIELEVPYIIPEELVNELQLKTNVIEPGTYQIVYNETNQRNEIYF